MPHMKLATCMHGMQLLEDVLDTEDMHLGMVDEQL